MAFDLGLGCRAVGKVYMALDYQEAPDILLGNWVPKTIGARDSYLAPHANISLKQNKPDFGMPACNVTPLALRFVCFPKVAFTVDQNSLARVVANNSCCSKFQCAVNVEQVQRNR